MFTSKSFILTTVPRRLIIGILVLLILGVLGGTIALIVTRLGSDDPNSNVTDLAEEAANQLEESGPAITDPTGDADDDGLSNSDERIWGTNPDNPDTDGDGFLDGEEVQSNHNPTIPGPDDTLPEGFVPQRDLQPLDPADEQRIEVGQFFQENLDLSIDERNLSDVYDNQVPDSDKTPETMISFVQQQQTITSLPTLLDGSINVVDTNSNVTMNAYLLEVGDLEALTNQQGLKIALDKLIQNGDSSYIEGLAYSVRKYQERLLASPVPSSAASMQRLLVAYTELVASTFDQIALWQSDPVKSLVALRQLDQIDRQYYPLISQEFRALQSQTGI